MKSITHSSELALSHRQPVSRVRRTAKERLSNLSAGLELWLVLLAVVGSMGLVCWSIVSPF